MITNQHPIAPSPEQVAQWASDQELEACIEWLSTQNKIWLSEWAKNLRLARRPKPPSLKNQALQALEEAEHADHPVQLTILNTMAHVLIREALESIPEL